ncbi:MAG: hypothetical protein KKF33_05345 [Alphaproteobacteria bacterium]|nr:hypothetical protein [Alphaproteobacteria bacterium]
MDIRFLSGVAVCGPIEILVLRIRIRLVRLLSAFGRKPGLIVLRTGWPGSAFRAALPFFSSLPCFTWSDWSRIAFRGLFGYGSSHWKRQQKEGCMIVFEHHRQCGPEQALQQMLQG